MDSSKWKAFEGRRYLFALLVILFIVSRVLVRCVFGFAPDAEIVENHWQHSDLVWLNKYFFETLLYLHSQPPLWNTIIGIVTKIVGPDANLVSEILWLLFASMTMLMMFIIVSFARRAGFPMLQAAVLGAAFAVSPTTVYYELYPFYPHLTAFLMTGLLLSATRLGNGGLTAASCLALCTIALSWTWAVFHPAFLLLLGGFCLLMYPATRTPAGAIVFCVAVTLSYAPGLKNSMLTGGEFASSWLGINLIQTLPSPGEELVTYCRFETVADLLVSGEAPPRAVGVVSVDSPVKPSSGFPNMNNLLVSERADDCFKRYVTKAREDPLAMLGFFGERLVDSHGIPPFIYAFGPKGWDERTLVNRIYYKLGMLAEIVLLGLYGALFTYSIWKVWRGEDKAFMAICGLIIFYFTLVTHAANGIEQQRMRVTIAPVYWVLMINLLADFLAFRSGKSARHAGGANSE